MNKTRIYDYICQLEKELLSVLAYNQFAGIITSEIVNKSIIILHELPGGMVTDEKTAKDLVSRNIRAFFTPISIANVIDKFQNWDNRVCYGYRGKMSLNEKTMFEFKLITDLSHSQGHKLQETMLHAVKDFSFRNKPVSKPNVRFSLIAVIICVVVTILASIGIYSYSINNRYQRVNADIVFDNWTGQSIDVFENFEKHE